MPLTKEQRREAAKRAIQKFIINDAPGIRAVLMTDEIIAKARKPRVPKRIPPTQKTPTAADWEAAERRAKGPQRRCGFCGMPGHILRTCPEFLKRHR